MNFWNSDYNFLLEDVISMLPELGIALQKCGKSRPPNSEQDFGGLFYFFPQREDDIRWQVNHEIIPKFSEWFNDARLDFPSASTEAEYFQEVTLSKKNWNMVTPMFASTYCLAILGQMIPYSRFALLELLQPSWGVILNTAATMGLLFLGETKLDHTLFFNLFPMEDAPLATKYQDIHYSDFKKLRIFEPNLLPAFYWKAIFQTMLNIVDDKNRFLQVLLVYVLGQIKKSDLEEDVFTLALKHGLYSPLTISGILAHKIITSREDRIQLFQQALNDNDFCTNYEVYAEYIEVELDNIIF